MYTKPVYARAKAQRIGMIPNPDEGKNDREKIKADEMRIPGTNPLPTEFISSPLSNLHNDNNCVL